MLQMYEVCMTHFIYQDSWKDLHHMCKRSFQHPSTGRERRMQHNVYVALLNTLRTAYYTFLEVSGEAFSG